MRHTLPGQFDLPATEHRLAELARLKAREPLRASKPQLPLDIGLFGDDSLQTDLVEMLTYSHEEE